MDEQVVACCGRVSACESGRLGRYVSVVFGYDIDDRLLVWLRSSLSFSSLSLWRRRLSEFGGCTTTRHWLY